jgi:hypothetical protein
MLMRRGLSTGIAQSGYQAEAGSDLELVTILKFNLAQSLCLACLIPHIEVYHTRLYGKSDTPNQQICGTPRLL